MLEAIVNQFDTMKLDAAQMTSAPIRINAFKALAFLLVALTDVESTLSVYRNYIVVCAHAHLDTLEIHTSSARQFQNIQFPFHQLIVTPTMIVHSIEHVRMNVA